MDRLCLASQQVTGHLEVEHENLHRPWTPQEIPNERDDSIYGVVTMETRMDREKEPMKKTEEDRWRELYPEIKKCVIVIARLRLDRVNVKLKQEKHGERMEAGGRRGSSGEPSSDWMEPVELDDSDGEGGFRSFVKKVEVRVRGNYAANGSRKPRGRPRGAGLLRLRQFQSRDVNADPTDPAHWCRRQIGRNDKQISVDINQSEAFHNYSLNFKVPDTPDTPNGKSQDASPSSCCDHEDGDSCSCSTEKKNLPSIVFKKVRGDQWALSSSKAKREKEDSSVNTGQLLTHCTVAVPGPGGLKKKRRRQACGQCAACLRQDCGKCLYCLDKRKFGGPGKKKQRCQLRVCLVVESKFRPRPPVTSRSVEHQWQRRRDENVEEMKAVKRRRTRRWRWGGQKNTPSAQEGRKRRRRRRRRWGQQSTGQRETEDDSWTQQLMKEDDEEQKKETNTPQEGTEETAGQTEETAGWTEETAGWTEETAGWTEEDEQCSEGVMEIGTYYEVEVEVPGFDSDHETLTASSTPSQVTEVPDDVTVSDPACEQQDFISLGEEEEPDVEEDGDEGWTELTSDL